MRVLKYLLLAAGLLSAWELGFTAAGVTSVSPRRLQAMLQAPEPPLLLDVRTPAEYRLFRVPGSLPAQGLLTDPEGFVQGPLEAVSRDRAIVLVCMTGHRSSLAGLALKKRGFTRLYSLTGGSLGWLVTGHHVEHGRAAARNRRGWNCSSRSARA